jgi:hypothetical protein
MLAAGAADEAATRRKSAGSKEAKVSAVATAVNYQLKTAAAHGKAHGRARLSF